jgi:hypothetical protein
MSDGAAVDPAAALGIDVLGDVGRDLESAAAGDEVAGVVVLIGTPEFVNRFETPRC